MAVSTFSPTNNSQRKKMNNLIIKESFSMFQYSNAFFNGCYKYVIKIVAWRVSLATANSNEIAKLNAIVTEKTKTFVSASETSGKDLAPEILAVFKDGAVVYKERWTFIPPSVMLLAFFALASYYDKPLTLFVSAILTYIWYDFFSGVLHIVLDNPDFIKMPILGDPCLEFQWHHHIPLDIASKSFWEVCGDLNVIIAFLICVYVAPVPHFGFHFQNPMAICLVSFKCLMAYFGQLCHCMSHTPAVRRPASISWLQNAGLMISPKEHAVHHRTYDSNFCIGSGVCNPLITWMLANLTSNKWAWLSLFIITMVCDVPVFNHILTAYCGFE